MQEKTTMGRDSKAGGPSDAFSRTLMISLFIILLAFFIVLNSIARVDEGKRRAVANSIHSSFGGEIADSRLIGAPAMKRFPEGVDLADFRDLLTGGGAHPVFLDPGNEKSVLHIPSIRLFNSENRLTADGRRILNRVADMIRQTPHFVEVTGHSDSNMMPPDARYSSTFQAQEVLRYLAMVSKIPIERLAAVGWGNTRPYVSPRVREARSLNDRIDVAFLFGTRMFDDAGGVTFRDFFFRLFD